MRARLAGPGHPHQRPGLEAVKLQLRDALLYAMTSNRGTAWIQRPAPPRRLGSLQCSPHGGQLCTQILNQLPVLLPLGLKFQQPGHELLRKRQEGSVGRAHNGAPALAQGWGLAPPLHGQ